MAQKKNLIASRLLQDTNTYTKSFCLQKIHLSYKSCDFSRLLGVDVGSVLIPKVVGGYLNHCLDLSGELE